VAEALSDAVRFSPPGSIDEVLEIDRVTRRQIDAMMKASCS
jgi:hypothetical protein